MSGNEQQLIDYIFPAPEPEQPALSIIVGNNVKRIREQQKIKKCVFAKMAGVCRTYLDAIEDGKANLTLSYLGNIADALGVPASELVTAHDESGA